MASYFPFFIDVEEKNGLIVGGGRVASHKIEKLLPFHPKLHVVAKDICEEIKQNPLLQKEQREFVERDLDGVDFVIVATDDREKNREISLLCKDRRILVNVVDDQELCGFIFPSIIKEGKLTVGVSTGGASPQIASEIKSAVMSQIPDQMEQILEYLQAIRKTGARRIADGRRRTAFYKRMGLLCYGENRVPTAEETEQILREYMDNI